MQPILVPVKQVGFEQSIQQAMRKISSGAQINLGQGGKQFSALSQPLGKITGQADQFTKSMEAANARVFAFGASVGIINSVSNAFQSLLKVTIDTEKALTDININLKQNSKDLNKFGDDLFNLAKITGQSFQTVADGALELSRQGLDAQKVLTRLKDALILSRLSGLDAAQSVEGLTAAINSFSSAGLTSEKILNKLVVVSQKYAVSERDLIEGIKRSASVADQAGVSFDELVGIITVVQERTARGGAVIGNAFKTIFSRVQDKQTLSALQALGVQVADTSTNKILPATEIIKNLAVEFESLSQLAQADIAKKLGGVYQLSNLLAAVKDLSSEQSKYGQIVKLSQTAAQQAYEKNAILNETLDSIINRTTVSAEQLGKTLGNLGLSDNVKNILNFFNGLLDSIQKVLGEESNFGSFLRGITKGFASLITGPGLALLGAIIIKLSADLAKFGLASLKSFFGVGRAAKDIENIEKSINAAIASNINLQQKLFSLEGNRAAQLKVITDSLIQQEAVIRRSANIAQQLSAPSYQLGVRATDEGLRIPKKNAAAGYIPAISKEMSDINKGVGGARSGDKPVVIPNFNFGGGKKGSIVAHTGEYAIPNFAGSGGTAIFNRDMVKKMGLPAGAKKINAAGGFIPNFAMSATEAIQALNAELSKSLGKSNISIEDLEKFRVGDTKSYEIYGNRFPQSQLIAPLNRLTSKDKRVITAKQEVKDIQKQIQLGAKNIVINASELGGILNISPEFDGLSTKSYSNVLYNYQNFVKAFPELSSVLSAGYKDKITIAGVATSGVPNIKGRSGASSKINEVMAPTLVRLASSIYGDYVNALGLGPELAKVPGTSTGGLLTAAAEGDILEAATKLVLHSSKEISKQFDSKDQGRAYDFTNSQLIKKAFGVSASYAEIKRNSEAFSDTKEGTVSKTLRQPKLRDEVSKLIASRYQSSSAITRNGAQGYVPNFVNRQYILETLKRIKDGTSGFSPQEQAMFMKKFGASANVSGKAISLRQVFDTLDSEVGISSMVDKAYASAGPVASTEQVYQVFAKQVAANPQGLRNLVRQKGFIPNFADPLKQAIDREMAAGVPASQIYIDKNSALKNAANPMGLMVANRRDEPSGGFQGIRRAIKEGRDPKTYGVAGGFIPNYAPLQQNTDTSPKTTSDVIGKIFILQSVVTGLSAGLSELDGSLAKWSSAISQASVAVISLMTLKQFSPSQTPNPNQPLSWFQKQKMAAQRGFAAYESGSTTGVSQAPKGGLEINGKVYKGGQMLPKSVSGSPQAFALGRAAGSLVGSFGKFIPVLGQVIFGFQALNAITSALGFDMTEKLGEALGLIESPAKKAAQELEKIADANLSSVLQGESSKKPLENLIVELRNKATSQLLKINTSEKSPEDIAKEAVNKIAQQSSQKISIVNKKRPDVEGALGVATNVSKAYFNQQEVSFDFQDYLNSAARIRNEALSSLFDKESLAKISKASQQKDVAATVESYKLALNKVRSSLSKSILKELSDAEAGLAKGLAKGPSGMGEQLFYSKKISDILAAPKQQIQQTQYQTDINVEIAKAELDARVKLNAALVESSNLRESDLKIEKDLTSISEGRKSQIESELALLQMRKKITLEQAEATFDLLKNEGTLKQRLESVTSVVGGVDPKEFEKVAGISERINALILKRGGYSKDIANALEKELSIIKDETLKKAILDIVEITNKEIATKNTLQEQSTRLGKLELALTEAANFAAEKRVESAKREYDQKIKIFEFDKKSNDLSLRRAKAQAEARKINANAFQSFAIERQITGQEINKIKLNVEIDKNIILEQLKKTFAEAALSAKIPLNDSVFKTISGAKTPEDLKNVVSVIENAEKQAKIEKIKTATEEQRISLEILKEEIQSKKTFIEALNGVADRFKLFSTKVLQNPQNILEAFNSGFFDKKASQRQLLNLSSLQQKLEERAQSAIQNLDQFSQENNPLTGAIDDASRELKLTSEEAAISITELNNSLASAKANLQTFANSVSDVFKNLSEEISRNRFDLLTNTDPSSIKGSILQSIKLSNLSSGPQTAETIMAAADSEAVLQKQLEIKAATSNKDKAAAEFELSKLKEILALRNEILMASSDEEKVKIYEKILDIESRRLSIAERLKAELFISPKEASLELEDTLVNGAVKFRDTIIDGLSTAIEQGGSLSDILKGAVLDFAREITKTQLKNISGQFLSTLNLASGGPITGGSGFKDDVPAMLMGGEYVINKKAAQKYGTTFLNALNNGSISGYAKGGKVQKGGQGSLFEPGKYGMGAISGSRNLLDFASQTYTAGLKDKMISRNNFASIALEAESARLTNFGRRNGPQAEALRSAKEEAFGLYVQEYQAKQELKKQQKAQDKAFRSQLLTLALTVAGGAALKAGATGFGNAYKAASGSFGNKFLEGAKGIYSGGNIGSGIMGGGLKNLFSGNFGLANQTSIPRASIVGTNSSVNKAAQIASVNNSRTNFNSFVPTNSALNEEGQAIFNSSFGAEAKPFVFGDQQKYIDQVYDYFMSGRAIGDPNLMNGMVLPMRDTDGRPFATGGFIPSRSGVDTVSAMLSGGEFIMNRAAAQNIGTGNLQALNSGAKSLPTEQKTEQLNDKLIAKLDELIQASGSSAGNITINVESSGRNSESASQSTPEEKQKLARQIRDAVIKVIQEEKRLGGQLRR